MADWVLDDPSSQSSSNVGEPSSGWQLDNQFQQQTSKESIPESIGKAQFRLGEDLIQSGIQLAGKLPGYFEQGKTEIPGAMTLIRQKPLNALKQITAGASELGQGVFNTPHDIINYLSKRLNLVPENINKLVQMGRMPEDTKQMIDETFGQPKESGEELLRGVVRELPGLVAGTKVIGTPLLAAKRSLTKINPRSVAKSIQKSHDVLEKSATDLFDRVGSEAVKRNVNTIPIRKNLISDVSDYLPTTKKYKDLLSKASNGDYEGLRQLQSDLWQKGTKGLKSPLQAEQNAGELMMELRDEINDSIISHFKKTGHHDLAKNLNIAKQKYAELKQTYYHQKTPAAIKNLVHRDSRKMPRNIMETLSEESVPMERIKASNPYAAKNVLRHQQKQKSLNTLKNLRNTLIGLGVAGFGGTGAKSLYDLFTGNK